MKRRFLSRFTGALLAMAGLTAPALAEPDAVKLFAEHCAACHGTDRLGGQGPALLPENLGRLMGPRAASVIADGRAATQMPGFGAKLNRDEIAALAAYISTPLASIPSWGSAEITSSRVIHAVAPALDRPRFDADPLNMFVVVESGDHHATILDGDRFEVFGAVSDPLRSAWRAKVHP